MIIEIVYHHYNIHFHNKGVSRHTTNWKTQLTNKAYAYVLYWRKYLEFIPLNDHICVWPSYYYYTTTTKSIIHVDQIMHTSQKLVEDLPPMIFTVVIFGPRRVNMLLLISNQYPVLILSMQLLNFGCCQTKLTSSTKNLYRNLIYPGEYDIEYLKEYVRYGISLDM